MPVDHKRINGPESSVPYRLHSKINLKSHEAKLVDLFDSNGKRKDGRSDEEHRKIYLKVGVTSQAKGSAYIEIDKTKVIVSVFDPREVPNKNNYSVQGEIFCELKFAPFSCIKRRQPQPDQEEKALSAALCRALQPAICRHEFPNFQVDICALVLQDCGSALSAAVIAAGLALADAGVPTYDIVTAATLGVMGDRLLLDPTADEESVCDKSKPLVKLSNVSNADHGTIVMSTLATQQQVSEFYLNGSMDVENIDRAVEVLSKANKDLYHLVQQCLVKKVTKDIAQKHKEKLYQIANKKDIVHDTKVDDSVDVKV